LQRGVSTGISISAPAIILSSLLGWNIFWTNIFMGGLLVIYTVYGGAKSVAYTQQLQLIIIIAGMFLAGYMVVHMLPAKVGFLDALHVSGKAGKLNVISSGRDAHGFNWKDTYNIWSGLIGGFFLALSYFGTDQVQVGRYLTARTTGESKLGLLLNGLVKIPMQFLILMVGALVFAFYQYHPEPVFFNKTQVELLSKSKFRDSLQLVKADYEAAQTKKLVAMNRLNDEGIKEGTPAWKESQIIFKAAENSRITSRATIKRWLNDKEVNGNDNDTNYIFLRFVVDYLPKGLVGLLIAVIFLAAWGSNAAALNSLASATIVDFHKRFSKKSLSEKREYDLSKWYTLAWGVFCIVVAQLAYNIGNSLIEAVNKLGSLFYGVVLGIFLVAFYVKKVGSNAIFISALVVESIVVTLHMLNQYDIIGLSYLWLNLVGALGVVALAWMINPLFRPKIISN
jgi:Na+/proline symporter